MLHYIFFLMLHYLQPIVALYSFSIYFYNVAVEVLHAFLRQGRGRGTGCVGERETEEPWG